MKSNFVIKSSRRPTRTQKDRILERDNYTCVYCLDEATEIDHVIPWAYRPNNSPNNLVACCSACNRVAGDKVFEDLAEKTAYILHIRNLQPEKRKVSLCTSCGRPFKPRIKGSTLFLCSQCADKPYEEKRKIHWNFTQKIE